MSVNNTSSDPSVPILGLAHALAGGSAGDFITGMEAQGQREIVNSDVLPVDLNGSTRAGFEAVGFVFGDQAEGDPLFCHVTLPAGWRREASDHSMWSYLMDELGRRRVSVFYKAAFYDRNAHMSLTSVTSYALDCLNLYGDGGSTMPTLDDSWATREAVADALEAYAAREVKEADDWEATLPGRDPKNAEDCKPSIARHRERAGKARAFRDRILAVARGVSQ